MRRVVALAVALLAVTAPGGLAAQEKTAMIDGRVTLGTTGKPVEGVRVTLLGARSDGSGEVTQETVSSDEDGRYSFEVTKGAGLEYALEARFDGGLFVGASFPAKGGGVTSNLEVWKTTSDPSSIAIKRDDLFVAYERQDAGVLESITLTNKTERAYIGRGRALGADTSAGSPTLGFALPTRSIGQRVDLIDSSLNRLYAIDTSFGFAATVAIPPGETSVTFAYGAPQRTGSFDLTRRALYPTEDFSIFVPEPLRLVAGRLAPEGTESLSGERYRKWSSRNPLDAGDVVSALVIAEGSASTSLWVGLAVGFGVIVLLASAGLWLRSRSRRAPVRASPDEAGPKEKKRGREPEPDPLTALAALDLEHEAGKLTEEQWRERRATLKAELLGSNRGKPT